MMTESELVRSVQKKFEMDVKPVLIENEKWRQRSRHANISTCLPGECPKPGDWSAPKVKLDEGD